MSRRRKPDAKLETLLADEAEQDVKVEEAAARVRRQFGAWTRAILRQRNIGRRIVRRRKELEEQSRERELFPTPGKEDRNGS